MFGKAILGLSIVTMVFALSACGDKEPEPVAPAEPPPAPVPVAEPVETDTVDTETATEPELPPVEEPADTGQAGGGISKASLIGNYKCSVTGDFPVTPPPATCKIYEGSGGSLKIGPIGGTGINGTVAIKGSRLKVSGAFNIGIGELKINANLAKRSAKLYKGAGTGSFAGASVKYTLTLKKM
ncbi:MAG: hypothetical protein JXR76_05550 [Deltaproteobacteria bacterium]|nr:hypothetical protein [Deltaproteobacteria bacterium]